MSNLIDLTAFDVGFLKTSLRVIPSIYTAVEGN